VDVRTALSIFSHTDRLAEALEMANTMMPDKDKAKTVTNIHSPVVDIDSPQNINAFIGMFGGSPVSVLQESRFKLPAPVVNKRLSTDHVEPVSLPSFSTPSCPWRGHHIEIY
jgi:hypothetical protein